MYFCRLIPHSRSAYFIYYRPSHTLSLLPKYPAMVDMSKEGLARHHRQKWYDYIQSLPTVEQKLYEIAVQQRKDLKKYVLTSVPYTYVQAPLHQYITRTHVINGLPEKIASMQVDKEMQDISAVLEDVVKNHFFHVWERNNSPKVLQNMLTRKNCGAQLVKALVSQLYKRLAVRNQHILESMIQDKPRLSAVWWHGGYESELDIIDEKNICYQYADTASFMIRMKNPLNPILPMDDELCSTADVPDFKYHPEALRINSNEPYHLSSIPGYWPGDPYEFPLLLTYTYDKILPLLSTIDKCNEKTIEDSAAILCSFGCLNAVATYQGFTPFQNITYPLVTQTILTNGQDFRFFVYQLNTIGFHSDIDLRDRRNICWVSPKYRLFETIENDEIKGLNPMIFEILLKFLLNAPEKQENLDLKPYLGEDNRTEEDSQAIRYFFRKMYSQSPDPRAYRDEIPTWQKIYKFHKDAPPCPQVKMD